MVGLPIVRNRLPEIVAANSRCRSGEVTVSCSPAKTSAGTPLSPPEKSGRSASAR